MLNKPCFTVIFFVFLNCSILAQERVIKDEYLKITPYVSTLEDVTNIYGEGGDITRGKDAYLSITYTINDNNEVWITFFRDCLQTDKPEEERAWIVEDVFFRFEENLKIKPDDIFLNRKDFIGCPYGDIKGQIIYFNKKKTIQFTYLSEVKAVSDLQIRATEENKKRYKCKKSDIRFSLDPKGFRCNGHD